MRIKTVTAIPALLLGAFALLAVAPPAATAGTAVGTAVGTAATSSGTAAAISSEISLAAPRVATETPAERARAIARALSNDPVYIDPAYSSAFPPAVRAEVRQRAAALGYPVYSIILPLTPSDLFRGEERRVLTLVMDALRRPGLYVVVDGGNRFPFYEQFEQTDPNEDKLSAARKRALDDTGYQATPAQVLTRMYELLALPALPPAAPDKDKRETSGPPERDSSDGMSGGMVALSIIAVLLAALVVIGLVIASRRRGDGGAQPAPRREKPFTIPPHVAATVAAERRRRLTKESSAELTRLGSELAALPTVAGKGLQHQQRALDAHDAAGRVLDSSEDLVDVVGAMVLLDQARREYDLAQAVAAGRKLTVVPELCAFNPLHGRSSGRPTQVDADGATLTLPLCADCRNALKRGTAPASLPGDDGPYWHGHDLWARTFFGALGGDLAGAVSRGEYRS